MVPLGPGNPTSFGATPAPGGIAFSLFSKNATAVELVFFDEPRSGVPCRRIALDSTVNKTGDVWHVLVPGVGHGQIYGWLVDGPWHPEAEGHRFNRHKLLLDPYAKAIVGDYDWNRDEAYAYLRGGPQGDLGFSQTEDFALAPKAVVVADDYDWERVRSPGRPLKDWVIYETHVRAMTRDPSSGTSSPGSYRALAEKIPYWKDLGITTVELLPVHEFNPHENTKTNPETGEPLLNFWGYSTVGFFSPAAWFASDGDGRTAVTEFKDFVKALHREGLEVILDVVYNHTAEGNEYGPTFSFRGLDNSVYYMLDQGRHYLNYSGCGNTLNCSHPVVRRLILDSLRYWVVEYHVDGFRFDLAAILGRGPEGEWIPNYSVLNDIALDPLLSQTKIIAEGWDAGGLFKVGDFPQGWAEWNSHFRDDVRSFVKSDPGTLGKVATRIAGSSDLFGDDRRKPWHSINFITAHDGFTLADLVSYNQKHNWSNAEDNRDGNSYNLSWNSGAEGVSRDPEVLALRHRQARNLLTLLLVSQGTPMLHAGDEFGFSKKGNNNTYCHDSRLNWLDWTLLEKNRELWAFTRFLLSLRKSHPGLRRPLFFDGNGDVVWMAPGGGPPDWTPGSRSLAVRISGQRRHTGGERDAPDLWLALHAHWDAREFRLPPSRQGFHWVRVVDTSTLPGFFAPEGAPACGSTIQVPGRTLVMALEMAYTEA
jgi:glycogen operon protein